MLSQQVHTPSHTHTLSGPLETWGSSAETGASSKHAQTGQNIRTQRWGFGCCANFGGWYPRCILQKVSGKSNCAKNVRNGQVSPF